MVWVLSVILLIILVNQLNPKFDKTDYGDIIVWINWKGKRIFKYVKRKE
jgi:hypothetical protein